MNHQGQPSLPKSTKVIVDKYPNKSQLRFETKSSAEERERRKKNEERKRKWGLKCYGFLYDCGQFDCEKFGYGDMVFLPGTTLAGEERQGEFVNCKRQADWICISTFKHSQKGRVESNISHILGSCLDLDGNEEIPITEDVIMQRCYMLGLPLPLIIETSPGRFHIKFYFKKPIEISSERRLQYWKAVQSALYEAFKDLGADSKALDAVRFLRNEYQVNAVNKKYPNKPPVIVREKGVKCSLSQLYNILKRHGFIKQPHRIPLETSRRKLVAFLRLKGSITATYAELSKLTSIPLRTLKLLVSEKVRESVLTTKVQGKGKNRKTLFVLKVHKVLFNNYSLLVSRFLSVGACAGTRDLTVFACVLELKIKKIILFLWLKRLISWSRVFSYAKVVLIRFPGVSF